MQRDGLVVLLAACSATWLTIAPAGAEVLPSLNRLVTEIDDGVLPLADVYELRLHNTTDLSINAISLDLNASALSVSEFLIDQGGFLNPSDLDAAGGALPSFRGFVITDSFLLLPEGLGPLDVGSVFTSQQMTSNYTTAGGTLVEPNQWATIAHLSVPAGELISLPAELGALGTVAFGDQTSSPIGGRRVVPFEPVLPEPTGVALVAGVLAALNWFDRRSRRP